MLRKGGWMAIILAIFSVLTACAHIKNGGSAEALEPKNGIVGHTEAPEQKNGVVGRWEASEPRSGLVNILEFDPDGKSKSSLLARVYMNYHIEGDKLILIPDNNTSEKSQPTKPDSDEKSADKGTGAEQSEAKQDDQAKKPEPVIYTFVLTKDSLKMTHDASGQVMDMWRDSQATATNSIVGIWSYKHPTGEIAHMIFDANGINTIRAPLPGGVEGNYAVKGDIITVTSIDKQHSQSGSYKLEDGKLMINDGKKINYYSRLSEPK